MPIPESSFGISEYLFIHAADHTGSMSLGQVGIPLHHLQRFVAQHFCDLRQASAIHGEVASCAMTRVMEAEILYLRVSEGVLPR